MILGIKSFQSGMEHLPLFHSVDIAWSPRKDTQKGTCFLIMPHLRNEATMMMNNLLPYLRFKYGKIVNKYFTQEAIDINANVTWDDEHKCVRSTVEDNVAEEEDDDFIGLGMAMKFVAKKSPAGKPSSRPQPQEVQQHMTSASTPMLQLDEPVNANTPAAAYYKHSDDDPISTMGMSATQTTGMSYASVARQESSRATLGDLAGTVIESSQVSRGSSNNMPSISSVFQPTAIHTPSDAQTTASSITMESFMQTMEQRQAKQEERQAQMFNQSMIMQQQMIDMMKKMSGPGQRSQEDGPVVASATASSKEAGPSA